MLASRIIGLARIQLVDPDADRWTDAELLGWLNDAQLQIVAVRPDAKATQADITCVAGTEQAIPTTGTRLLDVKRNVPGRAITLVARATLNDFDPDWYDADADVAKHYTFDEADPKHFELFPPAVAGAKVRIVYAAIPTDCAATTSLIDLDDIYQGPMVDWICYRAWAKNGDAGADAGKAANAISTFMQALGQKTQSDGATRPARK